MQRRAEQVAPWALPYVDDEPEDRGWSPPRRKSVRERVREAQALALIRWRRCRRIAYWCWLGTFLGLVFVFIALPIGLVAFPVSLFFAWMFSIEAKIAKMAAAVELELDD